MRFSTSFSIIMASSSLTTSLCAQTYIAPPEFQQIDKNGIDLLSGSATLSVKAGSIGSGDGELSYTDYWSGGPVGNSLRNVIYYVFDEKHEKYYSTVAFENSSSTFRIENDGSWTKLRGGYADVVESADHNTVTDTRKDGEVRTYGVPAGADATSLRLLTRTMPNGVKWTYEWQVYTANYVRVVSVSNNLGYKIGVEYLSNVNPVFPDPATDWYFVKQVNFYNLAVSSSSLKSAYRTKNSSTLNITTDGGQLWSISGSPSYDPDYPGAPPFTYKTPSSASMNFSFSPVKPLSGSHKTTSATVNGITYDYDFYLSGGNGTTTVTDPLDAETVTQYVSYASPWSSAAFPTVLTDALDNATTFVTGTPYVITSITRPEGDQDVFTYGARTNITQVTHKAKPGSGLVDTNEYASFPASCSNKITCNRPTSYTDRNGNTIAYSYAPEHGGILTETLPADANGIQPVKRYSYAQRYAWVQNGSGGYMHAGPPVWVKTEERTCRLTATINGACQGGSADEVVTSYDYGPDSGPNNLLLRGMAVAANGQVQRTCYTYDSFGNKISETTPRGTGATCP